MRSNLQPYWVTLLVLGLSFWSTNAAAMCLGLDASNAPLAVEKASILLEQEAHSWTLTISCNAPKEALRMVLTLPEGSKNIVPVSTDLFGALVNFTPPVLEELREVPPCEPATPNAPQMHLIPAPKGSKSSGAALITTSSIELRKVIGTQNQEMKRFFDTYPKRTFVVTENLNPSLSMTIPLKRLELPIRANIGDKMDLEIFSMGTSRMEARNYTNTYSPTNTELAPKGIKEIGSLAHTFSKLMLKLHKKELITLHSIELAPEQLALFKRATPTTLSRLWMRANPSHSNRDLILGATSPIVGGQNQVDAQGKLFTGAISGKSNDYKTRYIHRVPWTGNTECQTPKPNRWRTASHTPIAASNKTLESPEDFIAAPVPSLYLNPPAAEPALLTPPISPSKPVTEQPAKSCSCGVMERRPSALWPLSLFVFGWIRLRRKS